jgi:localization factor PodJL
MSRFRSKLETIADRGASDRGLGHSSSRSEQAVERQLGRQGFQPHDPRGEFSDGSVPQRATVRSGAPDLQRITGSLDRLAQRINSLQDSRSAPPRQPQPQYHAPRQDAMSPEAQRQMSREIGREIGHEIAAEISQQIGNRLDRDIAGELGSQLRSDIHALRDELAAAIAQSTHHGDDQQTNELFASLAEDLGQIAKGIDHILARGQETDAASGNMAAAIGELRNAFSDYSGRPAERFDVSPLLQSVESGHAEIASLLQEHFALLERQAEDIRQSISIAGPQDDSRIAALADHVTAIRDQIEALPRELPVEVLAERLDLVSNTLERISGSGPESVGRQIATLGERLDEITRAVVSIGVSPSDNTDSLDRIEARIATLAKSVEQQAKLLEEGLSALDPDESANASASAARAIADLQSDMLTAFEAIDARLGAIAEHDPSSLTDILAAISSLAVRLDGLVASGTQIEAGTNPAAIDAVLARLDDLATRLDRVAGNANGGDNGVSQAILEMRQRVDALAAMPRLGADSDLSAVFEALEAIAERIDVISAATPHFPEVERLFALEGQLSAIASQLTSVDGVGFDLRPLTERLDHIERQIAASRDIALEAAEQAAGQALEQAAHHFSARSAGAKHEAQEPEFYGALSEELRALGDFARHLGESNAGAFDSVQSALAAIDRRLVEFESRLLTAGSAQQREPAWQSQQQHEPRAEAPHRVSAMDEPAEAGFQRDAMTHKGSLQDTRVGEVEDVPLPVGEARPVLGNSVPIEPSTGMPDLNALVRRAGAKKLATEETGNRADLVAKARRAAHASAAEAQSADREKESQKETGGLVARLAALVGKRRALVLGLAGALVFGTVAYTAIGIFFAGGDSEQSELVLEPEQDLAAGEPVDRDIESSDAGSQAGVEGSLEDAGEGQAAAEQAQPDAEQVADSVPVQTGREPGSPVTKAPMPPEEVGNAALREAAARGDDGALYEVARRYADGEFVAQDLAEAVRWYGFAADLGHAPSRYRLASFYEKGHGVPVDLERAAELYEQAAKQGNALAMHNLAVLHTSGLLGGKPDMESAIDWFTRAAALGVKDSQVNLGILHTRGMGVETDLVEAWKWFDIAARAGDTDAAQKRDTLASALNASQLEQARSAAAQWKPQPLDATANVVVDRPEWTAEPVRSSMLLQPQAQAGQQDDEQARPQGEQQAAAAPTGKELVRQVQAALNDLGFDAGPADGMMGNRTRQAIADFQAAAGMTVDGRASRELLQALSAGRG